MPTLYVVAGPNGVGKTTLFKELVPSGIDHINADLIARTIRQRAGGLNTQDLANQEAARIFYEKVEKRESFSIETNLSDIDTYKSFIGLQGVGYEVNISFLFADDVRVCIERVKQRASQGGHNVNPDVVRSRYETAIKLLAHYKSHPDTLTLLDNSSGILSLQAKLERGRIVFQNPNIRSWVMEVLVDPSSRKDLPTSIEHARELYKQKSGKDK